MIAALALTAIAAVVTPDEKAALAVIVTAPTGEAGTISSSELIGAISDVLERYTDLVARVAAPELVEECGGAIACLAAGARGEVKDAKLLFVLSVLPAGNGDSAAAVLIDLETATEAAPLTRASFANRSDAEKFLNTLCTTTFKTALEKRGHFEPYAEVALVSPLANATLRVDGEPKGAISSGTTTLRLRSGARTLTVEADGYAAWTSTIVLSRGSRSGIAAHLSPWTAESATPIRTGLLWAGAGFAATGAAIAVYAAVKNDGRVNTLCLYGGGARDALCGSGDRFVSSAYDAGAAIDGRARLNPTGVMLAPLGLAIAACGVTWSLSMLLSGESADPPWLEALIGLGSGALIYGVAALANGTPAP